MPMAPSSELISKITAKHENLRARAQKLRRRRKGLFKKAAEYSIYCESDVVVAVRNRQSGQLYIFESSKKKWLPAEKDEHHYYPRPIRETLEDIIPGWERVEEEELRADVK
ncbi:Transcription factor, MADS-box [Penicillium roqueforti FM164]|uniref:Transcription factor, MADS-box n=1 Tax=Penicillium roqueforti (strain FM164) TaxID=1365484 RepID=W6PYI3_PENRF|nr:Transcription factor, MADS-box [Penicillium roqueforti FM164]